MAHAALRPAHRLAAVATGLAVALVAMLLSGPAGASSPRACLRPPVDAPVIRSFEAPPCPFCAGHRGVTFATGEGTAIRAAAAGEVTFAGVVVGTLYVVVRHADGLLATYGGLASSGLVAGDAVAAGSVVGRSGAELYFGLRTGPDAYVDPAPLLGREIVPPYLVPTDGSPRRPPPAARLECDAASRR
jgi:murein DD-endopeptidase MepM/ murein hydrolase activator NlpD